MALVSEEARDRGRAGTTASLGCLPKSAWPGPHWVYTKLHLNDMFSIPFPYGSTASGLFSPLLMAEVAHLACKCLLSFLPNALLCIDSP